MQSWKPKKKQVIKKQQRKRLLCWEQLEKFLQARLVEQFPYLISYLLSLTFPTVWVILWKRLSLFSVSLHKHFCVCVQFSLLCFLWERFRFFIVSHKQKCGWMSFSHSHFMETDKMVHVVREYLCQMTWYVMFKMIHWQFTIKIPCKVRTTRVYIFSWFSSQISFLPLLIWHIHFLCAHKFLFSSVHNVYNIEYDT